MEKNALILGGGIAGLSAALQLADLGYPVSVVTDESHIGGKFVSDFSSDSEDACIWDKSLSISALHLGGNLHASPAVLASFILRVTNHPNIRLYKQANLISITGTVGNFVAGIGNVITGQQVGEVHAGTIILATGFSMFDPALQAEFGYGRYPNVVTSMELERLLATSQCQDGINRASDGKRLKNIAFIQCVGSRDMAASREYCSSICCMFTAKEAIMLRELDPTVNVSVFYMDTRACGKNFEDFLLRAKQLGTRYIRSMPADIKEDPITENLSFQYFESGQDKNEEFDLVVLSTGIRPAIDLQRVAKILDIALNDYGFVAVNQFCPVLTNRSGIFAVASGQGSLEVSETLALAGYAATLAAQMMGEPEQKPARHEVRADSNEDSEPRIGIFLCRGGLKTMGVDPRLVEDSMKKLDHVVFVSQDTMLCNGERLKSMQQQVRDHDINRVVVGPCILKTNHLLFQEAMQAAGVNRMLVETASVPLQKVANEARAKAASVELLTKAIGNVKTYKPLHWHAEPVVPRALIVGSGLSGMATALALADREFQVSIVEKEAEPGGFLRKHGAGLEGSELPQVFTDILSRVQKHPNIELMTHSNVVKFGGRQGHFVTTVESKNEPQKTVRQLDHGAVILAIGTVEHKPVDYFYGKDPRVLTGSEARHLFHEEGFPNKPGGIYAFIQCVDSRNEERPYCSRTCCLEAIDNALAVKSKDPQGQVYLFYRDLRTPGFFEKRFLEARRAGVIVVQYDETKPPVVTKGIDDRLVLSAADSASSIDLLINLDWLILAVPQLPQSEAKEIAGLFHVQANADGFLMEMHSNLGSVAFPNGGIFVVGAAHGPQLASECLSQAQGVAARAGRILGRRFLQMGGIVAKVDGDKCAACLTCVRVCPFKLPVINRELKAMGSTSISSADCRGCGICAAECPNKAIELSHYEIDNMQARVKIALSEVVCDGA